MKQTLKFGRDPAVISTLSSEQYRVNINELTDTTHGMTRTETRSVHGDSHLGAGYGAYLDQVEDRQ